MHLKGFKCYKCGKTFNIDLDDNPDRNVLRCPKCKCKYIVDVSDKRINIEFSNSSYKKNYKDINWFGEFCNLKRKLKNPDKELRITLVFF